MRSWRAPTENPIDPVPGNWREYPSYQKLINSNNGQINPELFEEHLEMMLNDERWTWEEVSPVDFNKLNPGDRIRYISITQKKEVVFRTGGWIRSIAEDFTWLAYLAHTMTAWSLQLQDVQRLWVIRKPAKKEKIKNEKIKIEEINYAYFTRPVIATEYNSYLTDENGVLQLVKTFANEWAKTRFENTKKYKKLLSGDKLWQFNN